ncbi:MAG: alpha-amylase family glycosyl hydrolase [Chloroflexi bacterium]|nr:alpha-amylase family glycosyl hydrolase [Chloroflexota bacterium]
MQHPVQDEIFYFALTDRFQDGDPGNNTGGISGGPTDHGYDPTDISYYHGGDLAGLVHTDTLDYIEGLGISAIWITPSLKTTPPSQTAAPPTASAPPITAIGFWTMKRPIPTWAQTRN